MYRKAASSAPISIPGFRQALTTVELDEELDDVFDEDKARRDAINGFEHVWTNWTELAATIDWGIQDWVKDLPLWKTVDAENVTKNSHGRGVPQCLTSLVGPRRLPLVRFIGLSGFQTVMIKKTVWL